MYFLSNASEYFSKNSSKDIAIFSVLIPLLLNPSDLKSSHQPINPPLLYDKGYYISQPFQTIFLLFITYLSVMEGLPYKINICSYSPNNEAINVLPLIFENL
jgi:hypothetical protein